MINELQGEGLPQQFIIFTLQSPEQLPKDFDNEIEPDEAAK